MLHSFKSPGHRKVYLYCTVSFSVPIWYCLSEWVRACLNAPSNPNSLMLKSAERQGHCQKSRKFNGESNCTIIVVLLFFTVKYYFESMYSMLCINLTFLHVQEMTTSRLWEGKPNTHCSEMKKELPTRKQAWKDAFSSWNCLVFMDSKKKSKHRQSILLVIQCETSYPCHYSMKEIKAETCIHEKSFPNNLCCCSHRKQKEIQAWANSSPKQTPG